jgi:hypothetical protein
MVRRQGAHRGDGAAVRQRRLGGGGVSRSAALVAGGARRGPCSMRGSRRGEGRSATRTRLARGVSSPKRGEDSDGGSNFGSFRRRRG